MWFKAGLLAGCVGLMMGCQQELKTEVMDKYPDGKKKKEVSFYTKNTDPRRVVIYNENGSVKSDQFMKNGKPDSLTVIYYDNGKKYKEVCYVQNDKRKELKNGKEVSWFENGQIQTEAEWDKGLPVGVSNTYFQDGKKATTVSFKDGKKDGEETTWFADGKMQRQTVFSAGNRNGVSHEWFPNGNIKKEENYSKDMLNGTVTTYYDNGKKESECVYKENQLNGLKQEWYENGKPSAKAEFKDGQMVDGTAEHF